MIKTLTKSLLTITSIIFQCIIIHFKINNLQGYEMVSFDTVPVPPPVEDPEEKKEVEFIIFLFNYLKGGYR